MLAVERIQATMVGAVTGIFGPPPHPRVFRAAVNGLIAHLQELTTQPEVPSDLTRDQLEQAAEQLEEISRLVTGPTARAFEARVARETPDLTDKLRDVHAAALEGIKKHLDAVDDALDAVLADAARAEPGDSLPYEKVRERLGL